MCCRPASIWCRRVRRWRPGVAQNADGTVTVTGAGFGYDSRVFFDGLQAAQGDFNGRTPGHADGDAAAGRERADRRGHGVQQRRAELDDSARRAPPTYTYPARGRSADRRHQRRTRCRRASTAMVDITAAEYELRGRPGDGRLRVARCAGAARVGAEPDTRHRERLRGGQCVAGLSRSQRDLGDAGGEPARTRSRSSRRAPGVPVIASVVERRPEPAVDLRGQFGDDLRPEPRGRVQVSLERRAGGGGFRATRTRSTSSSRRVSRPDRRR